jgi:hypothetical protein
MTPTPTDDHRQDSLPEARRRPGFVAENRVRAEGDNSKSMQINELRSLVANLLRQNPESPERQDDLKLRLRIVLTIRRRRRTPGTVPIFQAREENGTVPPRPSRS